MTNSSLKRAVGIAMLASASVGANAAEKDLGNVAIDVPTSFNASVLTAGAFNDVFSFTLPEANVSSGYTVQNFPLTISDNGGSFNSMLTSLSLVSNADGILFNSDDTVLATVANTANDASFSLAYGESLQGPAYLSVAGIANGDLGGLYNGAIAAAVPEPETYAMLLAGLGLMGAVVRRRSLRETC
ncbi:MAG: FxDxF family PEP-CTERM protein [Nitrosospira sp.]|nr:FxDxF family PEP-CTERM protein [Nitrosospira sp.]MDN5880902.1 FxDxF family PEP-CTERM protein [Nitrosospira sp.]MDN5935034.1 FxDxF family PEP-CTERM protein [Nitrosospira sp.]